MNADPDPLKGQNHEKSVCFSCLGMLAGGGVLGPAVPPHHLPRSGPHPLTGLAPPALINRFIPHTFLCS